jgi:hypothetical protein
VRALLRQRDQLVERGRCPDQRGLGRAAPPHADDHRLDPLVAEQRGPVPRDRRLARALARRDHRELRAVEVDALVARRLEPRARRLVREAEAQRERGEPELARRRHDGLVGQLDDRVRARREPSQALLRLALDRHAVELLERAGAELLLAAAEDDPGEVEPRQGVANGGRVVLPVDQDDHRHGVHSCRMAVAGERR